jgi:hypothetical protein
VPRLEDRAALGWVTVYGFVIGTLVGFSQGHFVTSLLWGAAFAGLLAFLATLLAGLFYLLQR